MAGWDGDKNDYLNRMRDGKQQIAVRQVNVESEHCCGACTFLRGNHAEWCPRYVAPVAVEDDGPEYSIGAGVKF